MKDLTHGDSEVSQASEEAAPQVAPEPQPAAAADEGEAEVRTDASGRVLHPWEVDPEPPADESADE